MCVTKSKVKVDIYVKHLEIWYDLNLILNIGLPKIRILLISILKGN